MHHGPGDMGNWRMAHSNDVGVMTMKHNGGHSMGVQIRNRLQMHWDPNLRRMVQKRSIEDPPGLDAEAESTEEEGPEDQEDSSVDSSVDFADEGVDKSDRESTVEQDGKSGFVRQLLFGGHKAAENSKATGESGKIYPIGSNGIIAGGSKKNEDSNADYKPVYYSDLYPELKYLIRRT